MVTASSLFGQTKANEFEQFIWNLFGHPWSHSSSIYNPAFQEAVWGIVNTPSGNPSINGVFSVSSNIAVDTQANSWLANLSTTPSQYTPFVWVVQNNTTNLVTGHPTLGAQDVMVFTAVPEPETYAMLLAGLGLMGFMVVVKSLHKQSMMQSHKGTESFCGS